MIDQQLRLKMETRVNEACKQAQWLWLTYLGLMFRSALLTLVGTIEFELLYRTFQGIAGENNEYWSPGLMAMTGVIMLSAFHLLARASRDNFAVTLIRRLTPYLIGLYLVGLGLLASGIINLDAGGVLLQNSGDIVIGALPGAEPEQHWMNALFENITNPLALVLFSFGIGGLAIVNLFVAHELIEGLKGSVRKIRDVKPEADRLKREHAIVQQHCDRYRVLQYDLVDINLWSRERAIHEAALLLSSTIHESTAKHRRFIKHRDIEPPPGPLSLTDPVDPKLIERDLKKIDALDLNSITKLLQTHSPEETNP